MQGRGGTNVSPVIDFIDEPRGDDGLIVFTDGDVPVPRPPVNRRPRVLWLLPHEAADNTMQKGLRTIPP